MIDDRLLLATALVHARPGAELSMTDPSGRTAVVGGHPSADLHPCRWRTLLAAAVDGRRPQFGDGWVFDTLGGSLEPMATGGVRDRRDPQRRWFAVLLPPCVAVGVLRSVDLGDLPEEVVSAVVRPDPELGVTVVGLGIDDPSLADALDDLSGSVAGALVVAELCYELSVVRG